MNAPLLPLGQISPFSPKRDDPASGMRVSTLSPHIGSFARGSSVEPERCLGLTQAFRSGAKDNLPKRQQDYRDDKGGDIIEEAEQQHAGKKVLPVHLPQPNQHGGVEHSEPARGMAGKAEQ